MLVDFGHIKCKAFLFNVWENGRILIVSLCIEFSNFSLSIPNALNWDKFLIRRSMETFSFYDFPRSSLLKCNVKWIYLTCFFFELSFNSPVLFVLPSVVYSYSIFRSTIKSHKIINVFVMSGSLLASLSTIFNFAFLYKTLHDTYCSQAYCDNV